MIWVEVSMVAVGVLPSFAITDDPRQVRVIHYQNSGFTILFSSSMLPIFARINLGCPSNIPILH
jgi:hypothetical protein